MRALTFSILAVVLVAWVAPAQAQQPVPLYDPAAGGYVVAPNYYAYTPSPYGPRVYGPGGYYTYQPYAYNTARSYGYNSYSYYPDYPTYTYTYRRFYCFDR